MENNLLNEQVKSQFETNKEGGKCKMCKKFYKGKLSNLKDHLFRKHKEKANEIELGEATPAKRHRNDDEIQLVKRIKLEVDVNQLIREMIRLMMRRNLTLASADEIGKNIFGEKCTQRIQNFYKSSQHETLHSTCM